VLPASSAAAMAISRSTSWRNSSKLTSASSGKFQQHRRQASS
jgi:hypothetical protein